MTHAGTHLRDVFTLAAARSALVHTVEARLLIARGKFTPHEAKQRVEDGAHLDRDHWDGGHGQDVYAETQ